MNIISFAIIIILLFIIVYLYMPNIMINTNEKKNIIYKKYYNNDLLDNDLYLRECNHINYISNHPWTDNNNILHSKYSKKNFQHQRSDLSKFFDINNVYRGNYKHAQYYNNKYHNKKYLPTYRSEYNVPIFNNSIKKINNKHYYVSEYDNDFVMNGNNMNNIIGY